jgi:hypothetical protein
MFNISSASQSDEEKSSLSSSIHTHLMILTSASTDNVCSSPKPPSLICFSSQTPSSVSHLFSPSSSADNKKRPDSSPTTTASGNITAYHYSKNIPPDEIAGINTFIEEIPQFDSSMKNDIFKTGRDQLFSRKVFSQAEAGDLDDFRMEQELQSFHANENQTKKKERKN